MTDGAAIGRLRAEIDGYEGVIGSLTALRDRDGRERLHEVVRARRALAEHIVRLRDAGVAAFADRPELVADFRARLSAVMSGTALLQAEWPAVKVDSDAEGYRRAAAALGDRQRAFIVWVREAASARL